MRITEVMIRLQENHPGSPAIASASITFDDCFKVRMLRLIVSNGGHQFLAMPSRRVDETGRTWTAPKPDDPDKPWNYQDIAHPVCNEMREHMESVVFRAYDLAVEIGGAVTEFAVSYGVEGKAELREAGLRKAV